MLGSDTTGTTLSNVFYYLLTNPHALQTLQIEIDDHFSAIEDVYSGENLRELKYLNAVMYGRNFPYSYLEHIGF